MRTGASDVPSRGLRGLRLDARLKKARQAHLRQSALEFLEPRTLMAVLPAPQLTGSFAGLSTSGGNVSSPQVVVDRYNPFHLVSVWTRNDPALAPGNQTIVEGAYSADGGQSWTRFDAAGSLRVDAGVAPASNGALTFYTQTGGAQVAFDASGKFYVLTQQSNGGNTSGALVLTKFDFNGGSPVQEFDRVVRQYVVDAVFNPTLTVDDNQATFTDPLTGLVQSDPYAGNVWIAWSTNEAAPTGDYFVRQGVAWNPNSIQAISSSNGGQSFSGAFLLNGNNNLGAAWGRYTPTTGTFANATPKIAVSQGRAGETGGAATVVWDNFGLYNSDLDAIQSNRVTGGATQSFAGSGGAITQAINPGSGPYTPQQTNFALNVAVNDPRFTTLSKLTVDMTVQQPNMTWLSAVLIAPFNDPSTGLPMRILLFSNAQDSSGNTPDGQIRGVTGANLGIVGIANNSPYGIIGATFDDQAARGINDRSGATAGYTSTYRTEAVDIPASGYRSLNYLQSLGLTAAQLTGQWTLQVTAYRRNGDTDPAPQLRDWGLSFTSDMAASGVRTVAGTYVRGSQSGTYARASAAAGPQGIGPGVDVAQDNTLGSFSPHQGRIYVTYVGYRPYDTGTYVNPADNTDIYLVTSDDGGLTWTNRGIVNDDQGSVDGFSGANKDTLQGQISGRAQFLPQVAVDQTTGSLVLSWRDGRDDSGRSRSSVYVGASIDGGLTFSQQAYANPPQVSTDAITGRQVILNPLGDNFNAVNPAASAFGFGFQMGLAVGSGQLYVAWAGNQNQSYLENNTTVRGYTFQTYVQRMTLPAGPRIIQSTMGPVGQPGDTVNTSRAPDGGPLANAFEVMFDRPIDPQQLITAGLATFTTADVLVYYKGTANGDALVPLKVVAVQPIAESAVGSFGYTRFKIIFDPRFRPDDSSSGLTNNFVGTYSYILKPTITDQVRIVTAGGPRWGNEVDQNADGIAGQDPMTTAYFGVTPGDAYVAPTPARGAPTWFGPDPTSLLAAPFDPKTLPLIVPGAHVADAWANGSTGPDNLLLNGTTSSLYVRFDRRMNASSFTPADVLRIMGPAGSVLGPQYFPSNAVGQAIPAPVSASTPGVLSSKLTVAGHGGTFVASKITVNLNISMPIDSALTVDLVAPDGTTLRLFSGVGGNGSNFISTTFDDAATTPIGSGSAPFTGTFRPAGAGGLAVFNGKSIDGDWTLRVSNSRLGTVGVLSGWSISATPVIGVRPIAPVSGATDTFAIDFPTQALSGTYTVQLAPTIFDTHGLPLDSNLNAGLDVLRGEGVDVPTTTVSYGSGPVNQGLVGNVIRSTINVGENFPIQGITASGRSGLRVQLSLATPNVAPLTARLIYHPNDAGARSVVLFSNLVQGPSTGGFVEAIFDDAALTPISQSAPPFFGGPYNPQQPLLNAAGFLDLSSGGTWELEVESAGGTTATLNSWSLLFEKPLPTSGLGEPVADRANEGFRIFQADPANPLSRNTWTSVGPASIEYSSGRIGAMAADPSDPTGNTLFLGGASGGVWKTTNFLTTDPNGPTYIPLTDFGPTSGLNIGGIAVFPRNNDPNQSIVIASTGEGDTGSAGVGFLISTDGGATWRLNDSTNNVDASGNPLPIESTARDRAFVGATSFKVVVDPRPTLQGETIIYAALSGRNGGLWRSLDTGDTWQLMRGGNATDVVLDPSSASTAGNDPNLRLVYAAFANEGVFLSPNRGQVWNLMTGGVGNPLIVDTFDDSNVAVANGGVSPNGASGRITLAKPALTASSVANQIYAGWLYAAVSNASGGFAGLYMTKDYGQNWVQVRVPTERPDSGYTPSIPSNDVRLGDYPVTNGNGVYAISLAIDPTNPNVVYLGGFRAPSTGSGMIRVDATKVWDAHNLTLFSAVAADGAIEYNSVGPVTPGSLSNGWYTPGDYLNFIRDPNDPFNTNSTLLVSNLNQFTNNGFGAEWIPYDAPLGGNGAATAAPSYHRLYTMVDPTTGLTRLIYGTNRGVWSVLDDDGRQVTDQSVGTQPTPGGDRNGNLQITQYYYGAVQPSNAGTQASIDKALFYGSSNNGAQSSGQFVMQDGQIVWVQSGEGADAGGVAVDQNGKGTRYQAFRPGSMATNLGTSFFRVNHVGRTFGLFQQSGGSNTPDPQWAGGPGATFAVNPLSGQQLIISSGTGQIYSTQDQGITWARIGDAATFGSPTGYSRALAFGAPDPAAPGGVGNFGNFLYVGTTAGRVFLSRTGGGGAGNAWQEVSAGLDGAAIERIIPSPVRGSHAAYAVTTTGVFYIADSVAAGATWVDVTGNLRDISYAIFGQWYNQNTDPNAIKLSQSVSLSALAVDWRYSLPNAAGDPNGAGRHPVLYVSGDTGVFRSIDNGLSWTPFPDRSVDGSYTDGGALPRTAVTDLDLSLGDVNPATGVPNLLGPYEFYTPPAASDPNLLLASTWGRGMFAISMAPLTMPGTVRVNPADAGGTAPDGTPLVTTSRFRVQGLSMTTGFNNATRITIYDVTDGKIIGGFDPSKLAATNVPANFTDSFGNFSIQVDAGAIPTNGLKVLKIYATDDAGAVGNEITLTVTLDADDLGNSTVPADPTLGLSPVDNTGLVPSQNYTNKPNPRFVGVTTPGSTVELFRQVGASFVPFSPRVLATADASGNFVLTLPTLGDGTYVVRAEAFNSAGPAVNPSGAVTVRIKTTGPTAPPTLVLNPTYDSGIVGDRITNVRKPVFTGTVGAVNAGSVIRIYKSNNGAASGPILGQTTADGSGNFSVQLPLSLTDGVIPLVATAVDPAGNTAPGNSPVLALTIITTDLDYSGNAIDVYGGNTSLSQSQTILYKRNGATGYGQWYTQYTPPSWLPAWFPNGVSVGSATDIPIAGDFDGDGKNDLATFRSADATWVVWRSSQGGLVFQFGTPGKSVPVVGNFDGAGATQYGVYEVVNGTGVWTVTSPAGQIRQFGFGITGDIPLVGDFRGLGYDQAALYRPSTGQFLVYARETGTYDVVAVLPANQIPVPGEYDNQYYFMNGLAQRMVPAVFDPVYGVFTIARPAGSPYPKQVVFQGGDIPVPADYAGVGWTIPAVYRPGTGQFLVKNNQLLPNGANAQVAQYVGGIGAPVVPVGAPLVYRMQNSSSLIAGAQPQPQIARLSSQTARAAQSASTVVSTADAAPKPAPAAQTAAPAPAATPVAQEVPAAVAPSLAEAAGNGPGVMQPRFVGTAAPGTVVDLYLAGAGVMGTKKVGTVAVDATGRYDFQLPGGARLGKFTLTAQARSADGSSTPIAATAFQIARAPRLRTPALGRFARAQAPARPRAQAQAAAPAAPQAVARSVVVAASAAPTAAPLAVDAFSQAIQSLDDSRLPSSRKKKS